MIQEEIKDQQKKMEGKSFQEKFQYFWYYYKVHVFAVFFTILVIVLFANAIMKDSKEPSIYVALINSALTAEADTPLLEEYVTLRGIDQEAHPAKLDYTLQMDQSLVNDLSLASSQKYMSMLTSGKTDVIFCDKWIVDEYAALDAYENLEDYLSAEDFAQIKDRLYYCEVPQKGRIPVAFYAEGIEKILTEPLYGKKEIPLISICRTSRRKDTAADFIHYLLNE